MKTKAIEYSYVSSPNAKRFGLKNGGFTVQLIAYPTAVPKAIAGFNTLEEAKSYASQLPEQWHQLSRWQD